MSSYCFGIQQAFRVLCILSTPIHFRAGLQTNYSVTFLTNCGKKGYMVTSTEIFLLAMKEDLE